MELQLLEPTTIEWFNKGISHVGFDLQEIANVPKDINDKTVFKKRILTYKAAAYSTKIIMKAC